MLVDLLRRADVGVAQNELGVPGWYAEILEQGSRGMPQMVERDTPQARLLPDSVERARQIVRLDWLAGLCREDEVRLVLRLTRARAVAGEHPGRDVQ